MPVGNLIVHYLAITLVVYVPRRCYVLVCNCNEIHNVVCYIDCEQICHSISLVDYYVQYLCSMQHNNYRQWLERI